MLKKRQIIAERFKVDGVLAEGGYGIVYRGRRLEDNSPIVLKALKRGVLSEDVSAVTRFVREAAVGMKLNALNHPNLIRTIALQMTDSADLVLVIEWLDGKPLSDLMFDGPTDPRIVYSLLSQMLHALYAIHRLGVVHRDLKPSNFFVCNPNTMALFDDASDLLRLIDFGLARSVGDQDLLISGALTAQDKLVGTPGYYPPELLNPTDGNVPLAPRVDLFAVGIVGYELLMGQPAFPGKGMRRVMAQLRGDPPPPPEAMRATLLYRIIEKLMARDPEQRYSSARSALKDLSRIKVKAGYRGLRAWLGSQF